MDEKASCPLLTRCDVRSFVMKSVSDFADGDKTDGFQAYAAYSSASALRILAPIKL
jgi:hypothetical protein